MVTGLLFGFTNIEPIPVIILAQASNGIILPFVAIFILVLVVSNTRKNAINLNTLVLSIVVYLIAAIGIFNLIKLFRTPEISIIVFSLLFALLIIVSVLIFSLIKKSVKPSNN